MKSCPKCNRTFPDEGQKFCTFDGGLLIAPQTFDPNATIRATVADVTSITEKPTSRDLPDPNATITDAQFASTVALPRNTAPTGPPLTGEFGKTGGSSTPPPPNVPAQDQTIALTPPPTPPVQTPAPPAPPSTPLPPVESAPPAARSVGTTGPLAAPVPAKKKSKAPLILVGVLLFLLLGGGALAGIFFFVVKPKLAQMKGQQQPENPPIATNTPAASPEASTVHETPTPEDTYTPPLGTTAFENSSERLDGKLAEHFFDFHFYYPSSWQKDPKSGVAGAGSFVAVERKLPPDFIQERVSVGWYTSAGTYDLDVPNFPQRVEQFSSAISKNVPEYRKVSEGPTTVNKMKAYEFRYVGLNKATDQGDIKIFGRVIFLPTGKEGDTTGATLIMSSSSLAPELTSVDDLGTKGEAPVILESFRFGK